MNGLTGYEIEELARIRSLAATNLAVAKYMAGKFRNRKKYRKAVRSNALRSIKGLFS